MGPEKPQTIYTEEYCRELVRAAGRRCPITAGRPVEPARRDTDGAQKRILIVDDNRDSADMLRITLEQLGHVVAVAFDGPSALARVEAFRPSIVLLDIGLPVMDGYEVARRLRIDYSGRDSVRLLALTGYGQEEDRRRAREAGFEDHLVKPIDLDRLRTILEKDI